MANSLDSSGNFVITPPLLATDWSDLIAFYKLTDSQTQTKGGQILASDWETLRQSVIALSSSITVPVEFVKGNPIVSMTWGPSGGVTAITEQYKKTTSYTVLSGYTTLTVNWLIAAGTASYAETGLPSGQNGNQGGYYENYATTFTVKEGDVITCTIGVKASASSTISLNGTVILTATGGKAPTYDYGLGDFKAGTAGSPNGKLTTTTPVLTNTLGSFGGGGGWKEDQYGDIIRTPPTYGYAEIKLS